MIVYGFLVSSILCVLLVKVMAKFDIKVLVHGSLSSLTRFIPIASALVLVAFFSVAELSVDAIEVVVVIVVIILEACDSRGEKVILRKS